MSVSLNPGSALGFNRPLTTLVKRSLSISNPNASPVAFKVKTTAPKLYCVRPNSGRIEPGETVEVSVMLQAMKEEPPLSAKCRDKFLIQSTMITPEKETMALHDIWNVPEGGEEAKVHQQKLKVVYMPPEGQDIQEEDEGQPGPPGPSAMIGGGETKFATVKDHPAANGHHADIPEFAADDLLSEPEDLDQIPIHVEPPPASLHEEYNQRAYSPPPADFTVAHEQQPERMATPPVRITVHAPPEPISEQVSSHTAQADPELATKLAAAQAEIDRLRALLAVVPEPSPMPISDYGGTVTGTGTVATELRRRNRALTDDDVRSTVTSSHGGSDVDTYVEERERERYHGSEGVPLQVVIIIALGVFVTTYLFF